MKARKIIFTLFFALGLSSVADASKKPWTFLVYIAADNDLSEYSYKDIAEMTQVGSNENVNVLVYLNALKPDGQKSSFRLYIKNGGVEQIGDGVWRDSGDVGTFIEALEWAHTDYPSDHFAVVLWNHGSGPLNRDLSGMRGICYDDSTGNYLTERDCMYALSLLCHNRDDKKIDIVACDACLMAGIEFGYALQPYADYFVASQETIPGNGFEYSYVLNQFTHGAPNPRTVAESMVNVYADTYPIDEEYTLSAWDLGQLHEVVDRLNNVADYLRVILQDIQNVKRVRKAIKRTLRSKYSVRFDGQYIDVYQWLNALLNNLPRMQLTQQQHTHLEKLIWNTMRYVRHCVIENVFSKEYRAVNGMSIYFPLRKIHHSYYNLYWSEHSSWIKFLESFLRR